MLAVMDAGRLPRHARSIGLLVGRKLEYVRLGHAVVLSFTGGHQVLIETVAQLHGVGRRVDVEPGEHPSDALAALVGDAVRAARVCDTGTLEIVFTGGAELRVAPDADVESWAVAGGGGDLVVCLAGGELATWAAG